MASKAERELAAEQRYVDVLYRQLDTLRQRTITSLDIVRRTPGSSTPGGRTERDAFDTLHSARLSQLSAVEDRLVFGRLDVQTEAADNDGTEPAQPPSDITTRYIGRIGMADDEHQQLLLDWRAPAASPFYQATAAKPLGVLRRRQLSLSGRRVTRVDDEVLDAEALATAISDGRDDLAAVNGEGALIAALTAHRTGQMRDIVATLQAEQDAIVRSPLAGVLVVQGGPGTGKTAVALHRAAYLLYTHRERVGGSGVLVVGPSDVFVNYIEKVLPSLGETGVMLATLGNLVPGVNARAHDHGAVAQLKGDLVMARLVRAAVRRYQRRLTQPVPLTIDGSRIDIRPGVVSQARTRARQSGRPHNEARITFVRVVLADLANQLAEVRGLADADDERTSLIAELREHRDVRREINLLWLPLSATGLVHNLLTKPTKMAEAAGGLLAPQHQRLLLRDADAPWTTSDVPLLDEAAELIGPDVTDLADQARVRAQAAADRAHDLDLAQQTLRNSGSAAAMVSADMLVDRFTDTGPSLTVAERASIDRGWVFAHAVVDEAQELSPMQWRVVARRVPSLSMTVVGDTAQTGSPAGARTWADVMDAVAGNKWRLEQLTVNYRTTGRIMALADAMAVAGGLSITPATSARDGDADPVLLEVPPGADGFAVSKATDMAVAAVHGMREELEGGQFAIITPRSLRAAVATAVHEATKDLAVLLSVHDVESVKGLEYDGVVVLDPSGITTQSPRGVGDLYVALTRATQRLTIVHDGELPAGLAECPQ